MVNAPSSRLRMLRQRLMDAACSNPRPASIATHSGDPLPVSFLNGRTPLERQGALVFQGKQCRNCHSIGGSGGLRGPALDSVATKMTGDPLVWQVIQGGGNMPAYGKNLNPPEVTALVSFLETLHPTGRPPARDASQTAMQQPESTPAAPSR